MIDVDFQKQLDAFGIEQVRISDVNPKKQVRKESAEASLSTVKQLMSTMQGRQWLFEKLDIARVFSTPFVQGQPDVSAFLAGLQAFGQMLLQEVMTAAPEEFYTMNHEAAARRAALKPKEEPLA